MLPCAGVHKAQVLLSGTKADWAVAAAPAASLVALSAAVHPSKSHPCKALIV
jgi:hypothetical protein